MVAVGDNVKLCSCSELLVVVSRFILFEHCPCYCSPCHGIVSLARAIMNLARAIVNLARAIVNLFDLPVLLCESGMFYYEPCPCHVSLAHANMNLACALYVACVLVCASVACMLCVVSTLPLIHRNP